MVADLNGATAVEDQPGAWGYASAMAIMLALGRESSAASAASAAPTRPASTPSSGLASDSRIPFSVSVPVLSAHTTSTRARPSMAGSS